MAICSLPENSVHLDVWCNEIIPVMTPLYPVLLGIRLLFNNFLIPSQFLFDALFFLLGLLAALEIVSDLLKLAGKKHARLVVAPHQDANLVGEAPRVVVLLGVIKVAKEEAAGRLHALVLELPEADLVDDGGGQDGLVAEGGGAVHLLVGVGGEVGDDLVGGDAELDGLADRGAGDAAGDHVGEAHLQLGEEGEDGNLQRRLRVGVQAVVGLDDYGALLAVGAAAGSAAGRVGAVGTAAGGGGCAAVGGRVKGRRRGRLDAVADAPQAAAGAAGERGGEARGEEHGALLRGNVDEAKVGERREHVPALLGEGVGVVGAAELEAGEHKEEREHVDGLGRGALAAVHGLEPEQQQRPDLRVGLLQEEREARLRDADAAVGAAVDEPAGNQNVLDALVGAARVAAQPVALEADARHDKVQNVVPAAARVPVEEAQVNLGRDAQRRRHAKGVVVAAAGEGEAHRGAKVGRQLHLLRLVLGRRRDLHNVQAA